MAKFIKCSDYFIVKIRYYADAKLLKRSHETKKPLPKQHHERAVAYNDFFWVFIEKVTKRNRDDWFYEYMTDMHGCLKDEIQDSHGILISDTEGWYTWLIPNKYPEIIDWVLNNIKLPHKILRKTNLNGWRWGGLEANKWRRENAKEHTRKMKEQYPVLNRKN